MLEQILPAAVVVVERFGDDPGAVLFPEEEAAIARAVRRRQREFATVRACAHAALARLGEPPVPIIPDARGAPQWPAGVVGSMVHCTGYRAAAVARSRDVVALGFDAERNEPLPDGVLDAIALAGERSRIARLAALDPSVRWDRLLFCAKEAVYKTWFPLTGRWLDFDAADVIIDSAGGGFTARLLVPGPMVAGSPMTVLRGRWLADRELVAAAITVPARPGKRGAGPEQAG
ncbi:MAG: 4'-phosphopantetheinyl transferase superfamily protein [Actinomycetota bacterium]|nr:4'-phosphopantetheinyl transferase superfamily protein [Actinomycetota bacterium]